MILSGTVTSSSVGGVTVTAPADDNAPSGFVPVGSNNNWVAKPGGVGAVASTVTVTNSTAIDWSTASIFQFNPTTAQTWYPLFVNQTVGQTIRIITTQPASVAWTYVVWPAGVTFVGGSKILTSVTGAVDAFDVMCVGQSTFYGNTLNKIS